MSQSAPTFVARACVALAAVCLPPAALPFTDPQMSMVTLQGVATGTVTVVWSHPSCKAFGELVPNACHYSQIDVSKPPTWASWWVPDDKKTGFKVGVRCGSQMFFIDSAKGREHFLRVDGRGFTLDGQPQTAVLGKKADEFRCPFERADIRAPGDKDYSVVVSGGYVRPGKVTIVWTAAGCAKVIEGLTMACHSSTLEVYDQGNSVRYRFPAGTSNRKVNYTCSGWVSGDPTDNGRTHNVTVHNGHFLFDGTHTGQSGCTL